MELVFSLDGWMDVCLVDWLVGWLVSWLDFQNQQ